MKIQLLFTLSPISILCLFSSSSFPPSFLRSPDFPQTFTPILHHSSSPPQILLWKTPKRVSISLQFSLWTSKDEGFCESNRTKIKTIYLLPNQQGLQVSRKGDEEGFPRGREKNIQLVQIRPIGQWIVNPFLRFPSFHQFSEDKFQM